MRFIKPERFVFTSSGKVYAILQEDVSPLGLKIAGRPYIGSIEKTYVDTDPGSVRNTKVVRYKTFDYCGHDVGDYISPNESACVLFDRWEDHGFGGKILFAQTPWHVHIDLDLLVKANTDEEALRYVLDNTREWIHLVYDPPVANITVQPMKEAPPGWMDGDSLFGKGKKMDVEEALRVTTLFDAQEKEIEKSRKEMMV